MKSYFFVVALLCLLAFRSAWAGPVIVTNAWVRATVPGQEVAGAYMEITSGHAARLVAARSPIFKQKLVFNQLQLSITNTGMIDAGINVNMEINHSIDRDGSILDYCRLNDITIQPWSPFQYGFFEGVFLDNPKFPELNKVIDKMSAAKGVANTAIAIAWLLRHPAKMQPIVGTTNADRLKDICKSSDISLTREEWYEIYLAAGNKLP